MSRIGKQPIAFDSAKVTVNVSAENVVTVKGGKSSLTVPVSSLLSVSIENNTISLKRKQDGAKVHAFHGLYRSLLYNAVVGVSEGFTKKLILNGVGYRATVKGDKLEMHLGYSHPITFNIPKGLAVKVNKSTEVEIKGACKQQVGQAAANIRFFRPPEPFLGKGIRYSDEVIRRKAGKSAKK